MKKFNQKLFETSSLRLVLSCDSKTKLSVITLIVYTNTTTTTTTTTTTNNNNNNNENNDIIKTTTTTTNNNNNNNFCFVFLCYSANHVYCRCPGPGHMLN